MAGGNQIDCFIYVENSPGCTRVSQDGKDGLNANQQSQAAKKSISKDETRNRQQS